MEALGVLLHKHGFIPLQGRQLALENSEPTGPTLGLPATGLGDSIFIDLSVSQEIERKVAVRLDLFPV